jgi:AcrR family transcriptional regulator
MADTRDEPGALPAPPWAGQGGRRRTARRRAVLDRALIVSEALRIVDAGGVEALSFRRLADALDVTPMALYWHVADKAELLELVGQAVLAEIEVPEPAGEWRDQLRDIHRAMLTGFLRHANTTEILAGRARFGQAGLSLFERILAIHLERGFSPEAAFDAYQSLYLFTLGFMATANRSPEFRDVQHQGLVYMSTLPLERFPAIRAVAPVIGRRPLEAQFDIALDVVIEGIAVRLA